MLYIPKRYTILYQKALIVLITAYHQKPTQTALSKWLWILESEENLAAFEQNFPLPDALGYTDVIKSALDDQIIVKKYDDKFELTDKGINLFQAMLSRSVFREKGLALERAGFKTSDKARQTKLF